MSFDNVKQIIAVREQKLMFPKGWKEPFFFIMDFYMRSRIFLKCTTAVIMSFLFNIPADSLRLKWLGADQTTRKLFLANNVMLLGIKAAKHY